MFAALLGKVDLFTEEEYRIVYNAASFKIRPCEDDERAMAAIYFARLVLYVFLSFICRQSVQMV